MRNSDFFDRALAIFMRTDSSGDERRIRHRGNSVRHLLLLLSIGVLASNANAQYNIFSDDTNTVIVTGDRDRCKIDLMDTYQTINFGCPGHRLNPIELLYAYILPAMYAANVPLIDIARTILKGYPDPCRHAVETPNNYATRAVTECSNTIASQLPIGTGGLASNRQIAYQACQVRRADWIEKATLDAVAVCKA